MSPEEAGRPYTSLANIRRHLAERTQHNTKDGGPVTVPSMRISQSPISSVVLNGLVVPCAGMAWPHGHS